MVSLYRSIHGHSFNVNVNDPLADKEENIFKRATTEKDLCG